MKWVKADKNELMDHIEKTYPEGPLRETAIAYADSLKVGPFEGAAPIRNLDWAGSYTDADTFVEQAKIVGMYNMFEPDVAKDIVDQFGKDKQYRLGRESSVVVYVKPVKVIKEDLEEILLADEVSLEGNELRLWWD